MSQPIIVFDLDGTLVDTAPDLLDSLNHTLDAGGVAKPITAGFRQYVGHGGKVMIERAYKAQQRALDTAEHDRLFNLFLDHYGANIPGRSLPYPGVLKRSTVSRRRATFSPSAPTRPRQFSRRLIESLGLARAFCRHLRPGHLCLPQARSAPSDRNDRSGRRRPRPRGDGGRFAGPTSTPPRRPASRSWLSISATPTAMSASSSRPGSSPTSTN